MKQYHDHLNNILLNGYDKGQSRDGMPATKALFGHTSTYNLNEGFPVLTTKKLSFKNIVVELLWFLRGDTHIKYLDDHGIRKMWHQDAYNYYLSVCKKYLHEKPKRLLVLNKLHVDQTNDDLIANGPNDVKIGDHWYKPMSFDTFCTMIKEDSIEELRLRASHRKYVLGDCGFQYGRTWRNWSEQESQLDDDGNPMPRVDQIIQVLDGIQKNPDGRRHLVSSVDAANSDNLALYWCHSLFQFDCRKLTRTEREEWSKSTHQNDPAWSDESSHDDYLDNMNVPKYELSCVMFQRSADMFLGVPYNIASYALLTHIFASILDMVPGKFIHMFGNSHIYGNHRAQVDELLLREVDKHALPRLKYSKHMCDRLKLLKSEEIYFDDFIESLTYKDIQLENYEAYATISAELSTGMPAK